MASLAFTSFFEDLAKGDIDFDTATVKVMLVTSAYTENKDTHTRLSDVTNEVTGTGYTAGGATATCTVTKDTANDRLDISLGSASWATSTITAAKALYYISRGGAATADNLIAVNDFGGNVSTTAGTFTLNASTLRIQN